MSIKILALLFTVITFLSASYGQSKSLIDTSIDVIPHWKKDDTHLLKIKSTTTDINNGITQNYISTFDAIFKVIEATENGYKVEWTYSNSALAESDPIIENQIIAKLLNLKILIKLSDVGQFVELVNVEEVKAVANKIMDELIKNNSNLSLDIQFKGAKQLIASKQGLEIALLKQIKLYNFSFGFNYKLNYVQTNNIKLPNPLGGQAFDGVEKVRLTKLDNDNSICIIETSKSIDGKILKNSVINYVIKTSKADPKLIEKEIGNQSLEISENTMQQIEFSKGIIQKSYFKRAINLGFQNRTTLLEIETDK